MNAGAVETEDTWTPVVGRARDRETRVAMNCGFWRSLEAGAGGPGVWVKAGEGQSGAWAFSVAAGHGPDCARAKPAGSECRLMESLADSCALRWRPPQGVWNDRGALWAAAEGVGWEMRLCDFLGAGEAAVLNGNPP